MSIRSLDHVNIATERLAETRAFFVEVLGLVEGYRPNFDFAGHWLYSGERAVVHLVQSATPVTPSEGGALNHFAFDVGELDAVLAKLDARGLRYRLTGTPDGRSRQAFLKDPNGAVVELNEKT
jgi:catechol 2,3-dioxygenase-like lactoylglutathione lyase family enzyme